MGRVLVTGAGGFVGSAVMRALLRTGQAATAGVRRRPAWPIPKEAAPAELNMVELDMLDRASLERAARGHDAIVHCAVGAPRDTRVIVEGTRNILDAAAHSGIGKFIQLSSVAVYGDVSGSIDESASTAHPTGRYGQAKCVAEQACAERSRDMAVAVLRPSLIYGPAGSEWTTLYLDRLLAGEWGALGSAGEGDCNLVHVDDLAGFVCHLIDQPMAGLSIYNVNGRDVPSWNTYLEGLARAVGAPFAPHLAIPGPGRGALRKAARVIEMAGGRLGIESGQLRRFIQQTPSGDEVGRFGRRVRYTIDRMVAAGYSPPTGLDDGIAGIVAWHRAGRPAPGWL